MTYKDNKGFTLLELAISLTVFAFIMAGIIQIAKVYLESVQHEKAVRAVTNAEYALDQFFATYNRYPCPANNIAQPNSPNYGAEDCINLVPVDDVFIGAFPGYAIENGERIYLSEFFPDTEILQTNVIDPWSQRLTYAVTQALTTTVSVNNIPDGVVQVNDEFGRSTGGMQGNAHYVVLSHGNSQCPTVPPEIVTPDFENCDGDAVFVSALRNDERRSTLHYDDYIRIGFFKDNAEDELYWERQGTAQAGSGLFGNTNQGAVGINVEDPGAYALAVDGDVVSEGYVWANRFCIKADPNDPNSKRECFDPTDVFELKCDVQGEYMKGISVNGSGELEANCQPLIFEAPNATASAANNGNSLNMCPAEGAIRGVYTNGELACDDESNSAQVCSAAEWVLPQNNYTITDIANISGDGDSSNNFGVYTTYGAVGDPYTFIFNLDETPQFSPAPPSANMVYLNGSFAEMVQGVVNMTGFSSSQFSGATNTYNASANAWNLDFYPLDEDGDGADPANMDRIYLSANPQTHFFAREQNAQPVDCLAQFNTNPDPNVPPVAQCGFWRYRLVYNSANGGSWSPYYELAYQECTCSCMQW